MNIVLKSDYTGCLSMLMRYPPTSDTEVLIKQAIYLRDHSTREGGAYIIKQNALRTGKPLPALTPSSKEPQEGFIQIKNVLDRAVINKAVINAYGEVKVSNNLRPLPKISNLFKFFFLFQIYLEKCTSQTRWSAYRA
jgi:hypothetical protein